MIIQVKWNKISNVVVLNHLNEQQKYIPFSPTDPWIHDIKNNSIYLFIP